MFPKPLKKGTPARRAIIISCVALPIILLLSCGTYRRMLRHGLSGVDDYKIFPERRITKSPGPFVFAEGADPARVPARINLPDRPDTDLDKILRDSNTLAFLVIKDGTLLRESYFGDHSREAVSLSFSMAKSVVSLLVGCAIDDGLIRSAEDPVTDYIPELRGRGFEQVKLRHLLQMTSGLDYAESDNPFGQHARLYYCEDCLAAAVENFKLAEPPGRRFIYKSGENLLVAEVLRRVLGGETLSAYLERRVWQPLGMENDATWATDGDREKSWCCIAATARDFGKFGMLYLNGGAWGDKRIVSASWVAHAASVDLAEGASPEYQYGWWHPFTDRSHYMMSGHLGQYVYVNPDTKSVVVRLGTDTGGLNFKAWQQILAAVSDGVK